MENEKTVDTLGNDDHGLCVVMISIDDLHDFINEEKVPIGISRLAFSSGNTKRLIVAGI